MFYLTLLNFILFIAAVFLCFTIPGILLINKSQRYFDLWEKLTLGTVVGFVLFSLLSYFLLILNIHSLIIFIIFLTTYLFFKTFKLSSPRLINLKKRELIILLVVFIFGIAGQMAVIAPSGIIVNNELVFWSAHGHDGMWHLALVEELKKGYPLQNPLIAGNKLVNYHFFSDITVADFSRYLKLTPQDLYFRFFPFIFSLILGSLAFLLGKKIGKTFTAGCWSTIFTYFAGSFGFFITLSRNQGVGGESLFWSSQIQSIIGNPPQMVAALILLTFLYLFLEFLKKGDKTIFFLCVILAGTLLVFKVYAGIVVLLSLAAVSLWQLVKERNASIFYLFIFSSFLSLILYLPSSNKSTAFLIWQPWWLIRTLVVAGDKLNWLDLELRRQTYLMDHNWKRVLQLELTAFSIFLFGNLGMRFLGFWQFVSTLKTISNNYFNLLFLLIILFSFTIPLLFLQKGVAGNTSQFLQYFLLLFGILSGVSAARILNKIKIKWLSLIFSLLIIILAIPTQIGLLNDFYSRPPFAKVEAAELQALNFLKDNTEKNNVILTPPYNKYLKIQLSTPPIWGWSDTAYVSALSSRRTYLSDLEQLDIMGYTFTDRLNVQRIIFEESDPVYISSILKESQVNYLYFPRLLKPHVDLTKLPVKLIYENEKIEIWKID